jgi:thioredoxin-like negative regulator of GroEL
MATKRKNTKKNTKNKKGKKDKKVHFNSRVTVHKIEPHNASEFNEKIKGMNGPILFHSPTCIHCITLRPLWTKMIHELKHKNVNCRVLEVNAEALPMINNPFKVDGFPKIINLQNGVEKDVFTDERNVDNMLQFVLKHLKGKNNNLEYDYNLNKKGHLLKLTDPNNIKRVRGKTRKTRKTRKYKKI